MQATRETQEAALHPVAMERAGYWFREITVPAPAPDPVPPAAADPFSQLTEAERYAVIYPDRAARIRAAGGLPADLDFGPPEPELVHKGRDCSAPSIIQELAFQGIIDGTTADVLDQAWNRWNAIVHARAEGRASQDEVLRVVAACRKVRAAMRLQAA